MYEILLYTLHIQNLFATILFFIVLFNSVYTRFVYNTCSITLFNSFHSLREKEGVFYDQAVELEEQAKMIQEKADQVDKEADAMEQQINRH